MSKVVLISFDIRDDKRRRKVVKILEHYGVRVQYSVFELSVSESKIIDIKNKIKGIIDNVDNVRYYFLCKDCVKKVVNQGISLGGLVTTNENFLVL